MLGMGIDYARQNQGLTGAATGASFLANPLVGLGIAGVGAFTSFLGARSQRKFFDDISGRIEDTLSPQGFQSRYRDLLGQNAGFEQSALAASRIQAEAQGAGTAARFRRAGLSGVGETLAQGVQSGVASRSRRARDAFRMELAKQAREQQFAEARALQGLLQTPYGAVSPTSAALSGAGVGLEAWQNAKFAEQLAGRRLA